MVCTRLLQDGMGHKYVFAPLWADELREAARIRRAIPAALCSLAGSELRAIALLSSLGIPGCTPSNASMLDIYFNFS